MELGGYLQSILCTVLFFYIQMTAAVFKNNFQNTTYVQQWSEWYNTDNPTISGGDDESVYAIRQRGLQVCGGNSPIDSICCLADNHSVVFRTNNSTFKLSNPCTITGIVCLEADQVANEKCKDFKISFACPSPSKETKPEDMSTVALVAGLSLGFLTMCVAIPCVVRRLSKDVPLHIPQRSSVQNTEREADAVVNLPPSYSELFSESRGSTGSLVYSPSTSDTVIAIHTGNSVAIHTGNSVAIHTGNSVAIHTGNRESDINVQTGQVIDATAINTSDGTCVTSDLTDSGINSITGTQEIYISNLKSSNAHVQSCNNSRQNRVHMPGMHLSIHELLASSLDIVLQSATPPPSYLEANAILGSMTTQQQHQSV